MYVSVWNALKTILDTLIPTTAINVVYNYDKVGFQALPAVTITPIDATEVLYATDRNESEIIYRVRCVDDSKDKSTMEQRMRGICDAILTELRQNPDLNGTVCKHSVDILWGWTDDEQPYRSFDINIRCTLYPTFI